MPEKRPVTGGKNYVNTGRPPGRKEGQPRKRSEKLIKKHEAEGEMPLDYMMRVMRDDSVDDARRDDMAKACAPYFSAKLQAITLSGNLDVTFEDRLRKLDEARKARATKNGATGKKPDRP